MISRKDKNVQFSEYAGHFTNHIFSVDKLRMESLQRLQKIRNKRGKSQQRQLGRLASKYGDKASKSIAASRKNH